MRFNAEKSDAAGRMEQYIINYKTRSDKKYKNGGLQGYVCMHGSLEAAGWIEIMAQ